MKPPSLYAGWRHAQKNLRTVTVTLLPSALSIPRRPQSLQAAANGSCDCLARALQRQSKPLACMTRGPLDLYAGWRSWRPHAQEFAASECDAIASALSLPSRPQSLQAAANGSCDCLARALQRQSKPLACMTRGPPDLYAGWR